MEIDNVRKFLLQRAQIESDRHDIRFVADNQHGRVVAKGAHVLQPIFGLFVRVAFRASCQHDHVKALRTQEELVRGVRHDLSAEVPEMNSQIVVVVIRHAGEDARLFVDCVLDGDALRHRLLAFDDVFSVQCPDERGFADLAMADEDRANALELLCQRPFAQAFEVGVDLRRALRKLLLGKKTPIAARSPNRRACHPACPDTSRSKTSNPARRLFKSVRNRCRKS